MLEKIRKFFLLVFTLLITHLWGHLGKAEQMSIIQIRRNIPLSDTEPVYKDFYINTAGSSQLKRNQVVTAVRKVAVYDFAGTQPYGDLMIPVGQLKIIDVQGRLAVAREIKLISRQDEPMLEQIGIMAGDQIDLAGSFVDNKKSSAK